MTIQINEQLLDDLPDALIITDLHGVIQLWNRRCEAVFNISKADALGQSLDIIIPERLRGPHWVGFDQAIAAKQTKHSGAALRTKALTGDGGVVYLDVAFSLNVDAAGEVVGVIALARVAKEGR